MYLSSDTYRMKVPGLPVQIQDESSRARFLQDEASWATCSDTYRMKVPGLPIQILTG